MNIRELALEGEVALLEERLEWFAADLDFWRRKYLLEHPEKDNWKYVAEARKDEEERGF